MARRRFIQINGELVEVSPDHVAEPRRHDGVLWNDREYQDMGDPRFASRSQHREYMKRNGLSTMDDWTQTWAKAARERADASRGIDASRRADIERAFAKR